MSFETLSIITAVAASLLGLTWLSAGKLMINRWGGDPGDMALVIWRRVGVAYLSFALLFFLVRSSTSPAGLRRVILNARKGQKGEWVVRANGRDRNLIGGQFLEESLTGPGAIAAASSKVWRITQLTWPIDKGELGSHTGHERSS